jgi:hypothetical protein
MILSRLSFCIVACLAFMQVFAQQPNFRELPDGYYSDHVEVLGANPAIAANQLFNKAGVKLTVFNPENEKHFVKVADELTEVNKDRYVGFVRNGVFYWNFQGDFYRLGLTGMLSHVVVTQTSYNSVNGFDGPYSTTEQIAMIIDFKTGNTFAFEPEPFEAFLQEHAFELYQEFVAMKKRKDKKRALFVFLRRYNELFK